ncbi:hypothetical protein EVAR_38289_1 [Eumeta japonica]|uniref:Uncharacterized protein n=1 Tax=Eumeta variegata TaxID=151549 RepID=A0A4C1WAK2_EUMVA|nr:hypothetical protein EVAR_38289_1 [Eumeta japonica]
MEISMKYSVFEVPSLSMACWRRSVIFLKLVLQRYKAVSSAKRTSWTPVCERSISLVYEEYSMGEAWSLEELRP